MPLFNPLSETSATKRYLGLLTQTGTDAPVVGVLDNTLGGTLVWGRNNLGVYTATLAGAFPAANKTVLKPLPLWQEGAINLDLCYAVFGRTSADALILQCFRVSDNAAREMVNDFPLVIEILVYP